MNNLKILLTNLSTDSEVKALTTPDYYLTDFMRYPPLGLLAIAANVDRRHSIKVLDVIVRNMSIEKIIQYIENYKPDVLGLSVVTRRLYSMHKITHRIKETFPEIKIVAGGPHVSAFPRETMELGALDYVLPGFSEETFPLLIEAISNGNPELIETIPSLHYTLSDGQIHSNLPNKKPVVLDNLPIPDRQLINLNDYYTVADKNRMTTLYTSRGCPFRCIFCDVQEKKFHWRTPTKIVDEFEEIAKLGIKEIHILDDTFNIKRQRVIDMCLEILERGLKTKWSARARVFPFDKEMAEIMKKAGCSRLDVGVESLDPEVLRTVQKGITLEQIHNFFGLCKEFKIDTLAFFITGFPDETSEYRVNLLKEIKKLGCTYAYFNILSPLAKTSYYQSLLDNGTYKEDFWADFVRNPKKDFEAPPPRTWQLQRELEVTVDNYTREFYYRPQFILREIKRSISSPRMLLLKIKVAVLLFLKTLQRRLKYSQGRQI